MIHTDSTQAARLGRGSPVTSLRPLPLPTRSCRAVLWSRAVVRKSGFVSTPPASRSRAASYKVAAPLLSTKCASSGAMAARRSTSSCTSSARAAAASTAASKCEASTAWRSSVKRTGRCHGSYRTSEESRSTVAAVGCSIPSRWYASSRAHRGYARSKAATSARAASWPDGV